MGTPDGIPEDIFSPCGRLRPDILSEGARQALEETLRLTRETRWDSVRSPHIFMGLLVNPDASVQNWGERLRADLPRLLVQFQELFHQESSTGPDALILHREFLSDNVIKLLRDSWQRAQDNGRENIAQMDLLISLLTATNSIVAECFERIGVTAAKLTELAVMAEQSGRGD